MNSTDGKPGPGGAAEAAPASEAAPAPAPGAEAGPGAGAGGGRRHPVARKAATAVAVAAACSGLIWAALSLTGTPYDSKPAGAAAAGAAAAACSYTPTTAGAGGVPVHDPARARPYTAELVTDQGKVVIEAYTEAAPCATTSFAFLAGKKYFDGSACHRITTSGIFVLECGDPAGRGTADPGYSFPDENLSGAAYPVGTVALSKARPGRNGSQFFISYADPKFLMPPDWTPFGRVVGGLDVLRRIAANGTVDGSTDGRPKQPVVFRSVTVHPADRS
ncbi:peptidylprolyl isomerase [Streptomyces sp. NPDC099050]|uniref:peptidylprolyl isomerase n=1 Tax=Streptomyces sp. NPDC099050 TaxID=3366100 RepID=UPI0037F2F071